MELLRGQDIVNQGTQIVNMVTIIVVGVLLLGFLLTIWIYKDKIHDFKSLLVVALFLVGLPIGVQLAVNKTGLHSYALSKIVISSVQDEITSSSKRQITLITSRSAIAMLEIDGKIVFSDKGAEASEIHVFEIESHTTQFKFIINGVYFDKW